MSAVFKTVKEQFADQLDNRQIGWIETIETPEIRADFLSVLRIYINLVDNAFKYGGSALGKIIIGTKDFDDHHILYVSDNGAGLAGQDSNSIFGLFEKGEPAAPTEGAGIGLAVVKEIAKQHKGTAWVESGADSGTTFYVSIAKNLNY